MDTEVSSSGAKARGLGGALEPGYSLGESLKLAPRYLNARTVNVGTVAAIFSCSGPVLIMMNSALEGNLSQQQLISWLFSAYFFGGLISWYFSLRYRIPLAGAYTIPGTVMMGAVLSTTSLSDAMGAYFVTAILILLLGLSGLIGKVMRWLPLPIVMAMVAGTLIRFGTGIITNTEKAPLIGGLTIIGYFLTYRFFKKAPPIFGGLLLGLIALLLWGDFTFGNVEASYLAPALGLPTWNLSVILSVSLPLAIIILGTENAQAIGVLKAENFNPPVNMITTVSGIGGILASFFGGHAAHMAGVMTAICSSPETGEREGRFVATMVSGFWMILFAIFGSLAVAYIIALPRELINIVAGLSMVGVLIASFEKAFNGKLFKTGAFFALIIAMSGISLLQISAPFWALIGGVAVSLLVEKDDF